MFFLCNYKRVVDGANDNLSGCYMGIALCKLMKDKGINLEETEVAVLLTGSEEAGLRGAKQWAENHKNDYKDIPTYIISFDTIHDPKYLGVNYKDLNETIFSDKELADWMVDAAEKSGIPMKKIKVPFGAGATDSAAFTQAGFRSIGITALRDKLEKYYHTRKDSWDNLNEEGLENCLLTVAEFVDRMEAGEYRKI